MKTSEIFEMLVSSGLFAVLCGFVVSIIRCLKSYIDSKTAENAENLRNTNIQNAVTTAESCVTTVVLKMAQTVADDLKEKAADGKLTQEERSAIKTNALSEITKLLGDDVIASLQSVYTDVGKWLDDKLEASVRALKSDKIA